MQNFTSGKSGWQGRNDVRILLNSMARKRGSDFTVPNHDVGNHIRFKGRQETPYFEISEKFGRNEIFLLSSFGFKSLKAKG